MNGYAVYRGSLLFADFGGKRNHMQQNPRVLRPVVVLSPVTAVESAPVIIVAFTVVLSTLVVVELSGKHIS